MSEKKTTIGHSPICFTKQEFTEKTHYFVNFTNNFLKIDLLQNGLIYQHKFCVKIYPNVSLTEKLS